MKQIWKFSTVEHGFKDQFEIEMPKGAEILRVQIDQKDNKPCIWAMVNTENDKEKRKFSLYGTGHKISNNVTERYIGTYQYQGGEFVGHLFERL